LVNPAGDVVSASSEPIVSYAAQVLAFGSYEK